MLGWGLRPPVMPLVPPWRVRHLTAHSPAWAPSPLCRAFSPPPPHPRQAEASSQPNATWRVQACMHACLAYLSLMIDGCEICHMEGWAT